MSNTPRMNNTGAAPTTPAMVAPSLPQATADSGSPQAAQAEAPKAPIPQELPPNVIRNIPAPSVDLQLTYEQVMGQEMPIGGFSKKLEVFAENPNDPIPGYKLRWVNDDGNRLMEFQRMGYTFVKTDEVALNASFVNLNRALGNYIAVGCGARENGDAMWTYLMKCPNELYARRQGAQAELNDQIENAIANPAQGGKNQTYIPPSTPIKYNPLRPQVVHSTDK